MEQKKEISGRGGSAVAFDKYDCKHGMPMNFRAYIAVFAFRLYQVSKHQVSYEDLVRSVGIQSSAFASQCAHALVFL